jgi:hypothetical protein
MIRVKCPQCANGISIPDSQAGAASECPKCGKRFRIPTPAAKTVPAPRTEVNRPSENADEERIVVVRKSPKVAASREKAAEQEASEKGYSVESSPAATEPPRKLKRRPAPDAEADDDDVDVEADAPRKRKRRKKKKPEKQSISPLHIALVVGGLLVVAAATGVFFLIQRSASNKTTADPAAVLAELEKAQAQIIRDPKDPARPVIEISLQDREFRRSIMADLVVFPQLRKLNVAQTKVADVHLEHLQNVTSLRTLILSHTNVTGGGMQYLKKLVNLEDLDLSHTLVTDGGLHELIGLTNLKRIHLDGSLANGLELQAAIPGLKIIGASR